MQNPNKLFGTKRPSESHSLPTGVYPMADISPSGIFSADAHENLLRSKGFKATHYRHAYNPARATPGEGVKVSEMDLTGMTYYDMHQFYVVPQNLRWEDVYLVQGVFGKHSLAINYSGRYIDSPETRVFLRPGDILCFDDPGTTTVMVEDLFDYDQTGINKLRFPVYSVDYLADSDKRYEQDVDFIVEDGLIRWTGATKPSYDPFKKTGTTFSCVYWTKPMFVVVDTPKVFRLSWTNEMANAGEDADATYFPGTAVLAMAWLLPSIKMNDVFWPTQN